MKVTIEVERNDLAEMEVQESTLQEAVKTVIEGGLYLGDDILYINDLSVNVVVVDGPEGASAQG